MAPQWSGQLSATDDRRVSSGTDRDTHVRVTSVRRRRLPPTFAVLTPQEEQIFQCIAVGKTNKGIDGWPPLTSGVQPILQAFFRRRSDIQATK